MTNHKHDHNCSHHHEHHHEHHHNCNHVHDDQCHHAHDSPNNYKRFSYTSLEMDDYCSQNIDKLMQIVNKHLEIEDYGKAVPLLEIILNKLENKNETNDFNHIFEIKHHLALTYGIIGEHDKSIPLWKEVILELEKKDDIEEVLEAYQNAALSSEQAQNETDILYFLNKGLAKSKTINNEYWNAIFENELGIYFTNSNDLQNAEKNLLKAIDYFLKIKENEKLVSSYYHLAFVYEKQNNIKQAVNFYETALTLSKQEEIRNNVLYERSQIEERLANIKNNQLQSKLLNF